MGGGMPRYDVITMHIEYNITTGALHAYAPTYYYYAPEFRYLANPDDNIRISVSFGTYDHGKSTLADQSSLKKTIFCYKKADFSESGS